MSLYSYFAEVSKGSDLFNPAVSLSASVSPTAIREANEVVTRERASAEGVSSNLSCSCNQHSHGNQAAIQHFQISKQLGVIFLAARGIDALANLRHARAHVQEIMRNLKP